MTSCGRPGGRSAPSGSVRPRVPLLPPPPPPPPRFPAPPRFPVHLTALELRTETADGTLWQTEQRPPRRSLLRPAEAACGGHFPSVFRRAPAAPLLLAVASQCVGLIRR